jgi:hypothetical protein
VVREIASAGEENMASKTISRGATKKASREDRQVKIADAPTRAPEVELGEGGRYVYGIVEAKASTTFGKIGTGGQEDMVYTVNYQDIAAVVSKTHIFNPTQENALAHEHVIETVTKNYTIISMTFGTVFRTEDGVREVVKSIYTSLKDVPARNGWQVGIWVESELGS